MPNQEIKVKVERVCYPPKTDEDATWFILKTDAGTCKGKMSWRPREGELLILSGDYAVYQGRHEFKFSSAMLDMPNDSRGMLHYVCEQALGVGEFMETQIWDLMEDNWHKIKSGDVPRLNGDTYRSFQYATVKAVNDYEKTSTMSELLKVGCSMNMAVAAIDKWGKSTIGLVRADPYRLAELKNYGFRDVDGGIRESFGITDSDPRRIKSAIIYVMRNLTSEGSTLIEWSTLRDNCVNILSGNQDLISNIVFKMLKEKTLKGFKSAGTIALAIDYHNETKIWNYISK